MLRTVRVDRIARTIGARESLRFGTAAVHNCLAKSRVSAKRFYQQPDEFRRVSPSHREQMYIRCPCNQRTEIHSLEMLTLSIRRTATGRDNPLDRKEKGVARAKTGLIRSTATGGNSGRSAGLLPRLMSAIIQHGAMQLRSVQHTWAADLVRH